MTNLLELRLFVIHEETFLPQVPREVEEVSAHRGRRVVARAAPAVPRPASSVPPGRHGPEMKEDQTEPESADRVSREIRPLNRGVLAVRHLFSRRDDDGRIQVIDFTSELVKL